MMRCVKAFFMTWALMKACNLNTGNIITILFFGMSLGLIRMAVNKEKGYEDKAVLKRLKLGVGVLSTLFALIMELGYGRRFCESFENPMFKAVILLATFTGIWLLSYYIVLSWFIWTESLNLKGQSSSAAVFRLAFVGCFICYVPYFLFQFPGIMTPDSLVQMEQIWGIMPYSNHHPWAHTMLIKLFYELGYAISHDVYIGIAFYTVFQMLVLSASAAYTVRTLSLFNFRRFILIISWGFFALIPYNGIFAVTMWKDIVFSAAVLFFVNAMVRLIKNEAGRAEYFILFISSFWMCVGRSNGWYAMLITAPLVCISLLKAKKRLPAGLILGAVLLAVVVKWPVMNALGVAQPDFAESISIPLQMTARVLVNDRPLDLDERAMIESVIDTTYVKELYEPTFADNMKELVRAGHPEYLESHKKEFLGLFLKIGMKYPIDYLEAYIDQTRGYFQPEAFDLIGKCFGNCS